MMQWDTPSIAAGHMDAVIRVYDKAGSVIGSKGYGLAGSAFSIFDTEVLRVLAT